jgi:hypothetical protein
MERTAHENPASEKLDSSNYCVLGLNEFGMKASVRPDGSKRTFSPHSPDSVLNSGIRAAIHLL